MTMFPTGSQVLQITNLFTEINYKISILRLIRKVFLRSLENVSFLHRTLAREIFVPFLAQNT